MSESSGPAFGINSWLEDELYLEYLNDRKAVDESWKKVFETNGSPKPGGNAITQNGNGVETAYSSGNGVGYAPAPTVAPPAHQTVSGEQLVPLRGASARIAENMTASLSIPTATSQRV